MTRTDVVLLAVPIVGALLGVAAVYVVNRVALRLLGKV